MKTFVTISAGVLLALSCVATSDARLHANREGQTQSEPSNYNPDQDSEISTLDNSCLHCGATTGLAHTLPSYESNGFPITPLDPDDGPITTCSDSITVSTPACSASTATCTRSSRSRGSTIVQFSLSTSTAPGGRWGTGVSGRDSVIAVVGQPASIRAGLVRIMHSR